MSSEQKIKQHVYTYSKKISAEVGDHFSLNFDPNALDLIAEFAYKKLGFYGSDLEAFQKHAKRSTINLDDVKLLVRRNPTLKTLVNEKAEIQQTLKPPAATESATAGGAKRKRKITTTISNSITESV